MNIDKDNMDRCLSWFDDCYSKNPTNVEEYLKYSNIISDAISKAYSSGFGTKDVEVIISLGTRGSVK